MTFSTARMMLTWSERTTNSNSSPAPSVTRERAPKTNANARFMRGPASATTVTSLSPRRRFQGFRGMGLA
jgi:hypothetical protein